MNKKLKTAIANTMVLLGGSPEIAEAIRDYDKDNKGGLNELLEKLKISNLLLATNGGLFRNISSLKERLFYCNKSECGIGEGGLTQELKMHISMMLVLLGGDLEIAEAVRDCNESNKNDLIKKLHTYNEQLYKSVEERIHYFWLNHKKLKYSFEYGDDLSHTLCLLRELKCI